MGLQECMTVIACRSLAPSRSTSKRLPLARGSLLLQLFFKMGYDTKSYEASSTPKVGPFVSDLLRV